MKWLNDKDSVTQDELIANRKTADTDADAYASEAEVAAGVYAAAVYAAAADKYAKAAAYANAEKCVNKYFERTCEDKQDYIDDLFGGK